MKKFIFISTLLIASLSLYAGHSSMIIEVDAGDPATICYGESLKLADLGASISGDVTDGLWFTYGDGIFLPGAESNGIFSTTTQYQPGQQDQANGSFTLILVSDDPDGNGPMVEVSDEVVITFMNAPALVCNSSINVSLSEGCEQEVDVTMLLANAAQPFNKYQIELEDADGNIIPDNLLTVDHLGSNVTFVVSHDCTSAYCDGTIEVNDNIAPFLNCIDTEADCENGTDPEATGFPIPFYATATADGDNQYIVTNFDDCSDVTLSYTDVEQTLICQTTGFVKEITRTWSATDGAGNNSLCEQVIRVRPLSLADVVLPQNYDGIVNDPLSCDGSWVALDNGYPSPESTGSPAFPACGNIESTYTDVYFEECGAGFKIVRQWFIIDWCMASSNSINHNQIIKILDTDGPVFECPADLTIGTKPYSCGSLVEELSFDLDVSDCSEISGSYQILTTEGFDVSNLYLTDNIIEDLPVGEYELVYIATDECGNTGECATSLLVEDTAAPFAVCEGFTKISLGSNGIAELFATSVDDESFDNCGDITMEIAKMSDECNWGLSFGAKVHFCCEEVGDSVMVAFRVTDASGLSNTCMVTVLIEDKLPPVVECPSDLTISCEYDFIFEDLSVFGEMTEGTSPSQAIIIDGQEVGVYGYFYDNCGATVEENATDDIDCGEGTITRTFTVTDLYGQTSSCTQVITLVNDDPFLESDITWPANFVMNGCDTIQANPDVSGEPILSGEKCALVSSTYDDQVFYISDGSCVKILREWSVIDWCQFDAETGVGLWTYLQEIKLKNIIAPTILSCDDQQECTYDDDCESGMITITAYANDDCTDSLNLLYLWQLDLDDDGVVDETGEGISFDRELSLGRHRVFWIVEDGCGNQADCNYEIDVRDCKNPTPYCNSSITTTIMPEAGEIDIWALDFDLGSTDNCTAQSDLIFSFSTDIDDNRRVITCDSIINGVAQAFSYNMYVTDEWGNQERCAVTFIVQDNSDWCTDGTIKGNIKGKVATQKNRRIPDAEIDIVASIDTFSGFEMTGMDGKFQYGATPEMLRYVLRPYYNSSASKGVTTLDLVQIQRHILGLAEFDNPYNILASDVNNNDKVSSSDLLIMRKMILGVITVWPNDLQNWKFVDSSYVFEDIFDPFVFPDSIVIDRLMDTTHAANFIAVKVGDVNGSYNPGFQSIDDDIEARSDQEVSVVISESHQADQFINTLSFYADEVLDGLQFSAEVGEGAIVKSDFLSENDYTILDGVLRVSWLNITNANLEDLVFIEVSGTEKIEFTDDLALEAYIEAEPFDVSVDRQKEEIEPTIKGELLKILENPFSNDLRVIAENSIDKLNIEIFNAIGESIYVDSFIYQSYITLPENIFDRTGVYFLKITQNENQQVQKVVKM